MSALASEEIKLENWGNSLIQEDEYFCELQQLAPPPSNPLSIYLCGKYLGVVTLIVHFVSLCLPIKQLTIANTQHRRREFWWFELLHLNYWLE